MNRPGSASRFYQEAGGCSPVYRRAPSLCTHRHSLLREHSVGKGSRPLCPRIGVCGNRSIHTNPEYPSAATPTRYDRLFAMVLAVFAHVFAIGFVAVLLHEVGVDASDSKIAG